MNYELQAKVEDIIINTQHQEDHENQIEVHDIDDDGFVDQSYKPCGGCLMLFICFLILGLGVVFIAIGIIFDIVALIVIGLVINCFTLIILIPGLFCLQPNEGAVTILCGNY